MNIKETKKNIIQAGQVAVDELIKVAKEPIVDSGDDVSADRLKNAAATKKLAIFDAFEILNRMEAEEAILDGKPIEEEKPKRSYSISPEKRSK
jgi:ASC-1-like (ASCH) protein